MNSSRKRRVAKIKFCIIACLNMSFEESRVFLSRQHDKQRISFVTNDEKIFFFLTGVDIKRVMLFV